MFYLSPASKLGASSQGKTKIQAGLEAGEPYEEHS
jgi:hypothetical protein